MTRPTRNRDYSTQSLSGHKTRLYLNRVDHNLIRPDRYGSAQSVYDSNHARPKLKPKRTGPGRHELDPNVSVLA